MKVWLLIITFTCSTCCLAAFPQLAPPEFNIILLDDLPSPNPLDEKELPDELVYTVLKEITKYRPQIKFQYKSVPMKRVWRLIQTMTNVCLANKIKTPEREGAASFSTYPLTIYPQVKLIGKKDTLKFLPDHLTLSQLTGPFQSVHIGATAGRSYGFEIDKMIREKPNSIWLRSAEFSSEKLIEMMTIDKIDAVFEYSSEFTTSLKLLELDINNYRFISIDQPSSVVMGHLACAKNNSTIQFLKLVDEVYQIPEFRQFLKAIFARYFPQQDLHFIEQQWQQVYREANKKLN